MRRPSITLQLTLLFALSSTLILGAVGGALGVLIEEHFVAEDVHEMKMKAANALPPLAEARIVTFQEAGRTFRGIARKEGGEVVASMEISHHEAFMRVFRRALALSILLGMVISVPLGWIAARRGMAPLRAFTGLAGRVSAERLSERVASERIPIELTPLVSAFNDMLARLEDAFGRLSDFSSDLAHELRTPITNVMTQTQVALSRARDADDYREVLYSNLEEFQRLARIVEDMLFLAKSEHPMELPEKVPVDLTAETDALIEFFEALAGERGVRLARIGEASARGDPLMIRRALANLISNGIRHTGAGGTVTVTLSRGNATASATVENPGADIPPEHLSRLFDRFYRVDAARGREDGGSGLGLAITKAIADRHGGRIEVASSGGLTRFVLSLPA